MQRVERRETKAVGSLEVMKELPHELGRTLVLLVPRVGENQMSAPISRRPPFGVGS
jgi:hypothetical protein